MKWREHCRPIIEKVIAEIGTDDRKKLRKVLKDAYPYGERKMWPYKVWLSEIKKQLESGQKEIETPLFNEVKK